MKNAKELWQQWNNAAEKDADGWIIPYDNWLEIQLSESQKECERKEGAVQMWKKWTVKATQQVTELTAEVERLTEANKMTSKGDWNEPEPQPASRVASLWIDKVKSLTAEVERLKKEKITNMETLKYSEMSDAELIDFLKNFTHSELWNGGVSELLARFERPTNRVRTQSSPDESIVAPESKDVAQGFDATTYKPSKE